MFMNHLTTKGITVMYYVSIYKTVSKFLFPTAVFHVKIGLWLSARRRNLHICVWGGACNLKNYFNKMSLSQFMHIFFFGLN